MGLPGPLRAVPFWTPWAFMGWALMCPLCPYGPGRYGPPWALMGRALMGLAGPSWAGPLLGLPGPLGPIYIYIYTCISVCIYIYERSCKLFVRKILKSGGHITVLFIPSCTHACMHPCIHAGPLWAGPLCIYMHGAITQCLKSGKAVMDAYNCWKIILMLSLCNF